ncbi:MAG: YggS family pyridoxal phosphate-dependent enzyme [Defluviitaleaceae bacterium]|nr:YggS family pyridoxal phosphate-dependent enzyme [Defluviitaleaceae bacterium]
MVITGADGVAKQRATRPACEASERVDENVRIIRENIARAAEKSGRSATNVKLIGVTKTVDVSRIRTLLACGVTDLGENRAQEFLPKYVELLDEAPSWHFIGHLQRNKVKQIIDKVCMIHSVDSLDLALEIDKRAKMANKVIDVLIEINIAGEANKQGTSPENAKVFSEQVFELPNVRLRGLMCVPPFVENSEENRLFFRKMRILGVDIFGTGRYNSITSYDSIPCELSMGMSGDYAAAIEEGATMVRIGTALVGGR